MRVLLLITACNLLAQPGLSDVLTRRRRSYDPPGAVCTAANFAAVCNQQHARRRMGLDRSCCASSNQQIGTGMSGNCVFQCTEMGDYRDDTPAMFVGQANSRPYQLCQEVNRTTGSVIPYSSIYCGECYGGCHIDHQCRTRSFCPLILSCS